MRKWYFYFRKNHFYILHFTFNILHFFLATKTQSHKETRRLFFHSVDNFYYSPLPSGEGSGVRFFFMRKWYFDFRKNHFYILPRDFGAGYSIFYILHSPRHYEPQKLFYFRIDNFPLRGAEGAPTSLFLIFTFLLFISLATKTLRHKEPRSLFFKIFYFLLFTFYFLLKTKEPTD